MLAKMKLATNGRWLWSRTIGSTVVGQGLDSVVFVILAFTGTVPTRALFGIILVNWVFKSVYEAAATPLTYLIVGFLKRQENSDVYDYDTKFNPFLVTK